jgi:hypothetical protein
LNTRGPPPPASGWSRDVGEGWGIYQQNPPPWNRLLSPVHPRGPVSGIVTPPSVKREEEDWA